MLRYFKGTKSRKETIKTLAEIFFHMPIMYRVMLDMAGFALQFREAGKHI